MTTLFFIVAKLAGAFLRVESYLLLALLLTIVAAQRGHLRTARTLSASLAIAVLLLGIFPLGDLLLQPLERTYPPQPPLGAVHGIVVLGGSEMANASQYWQQVQLNEAGERFTAALALAHRFPEARVLFTGGSGRLRDLAAPANGAREAAIAERFFAEQGITAPRLLLEEASRNTAENARLSRVIANPQPGETWVLVTSAFHLPRAMRSFTAAGWTGLVPWPVDYRTANFTDGIGWDLPGHLLVLNTAMREQVGQVAYALFAR
jgi:uncharacterized SAM-binding protein YcdF (DUF218 family)